MFTVYFFYDGFSVRGHPSNLVSRDVFITVTSLWPLGDPSAGFWVFLKASQKSVSQFSIQSLNSLPHARRAHRVRARGYWPQSLRPNGVMPWIPGLATGAVGHSVLLPSLADFRLRADL